MVPSVAQENRKGPISLQVTAGQNRSNLIVYIYLDLMVCKSASKVMRVEDSMPSNLL